MTAQPSFGCLPPPKRLNTKGRTWSRASRQWARREDPELLAYVAACWRREPTGLLSGRDAERVRQAGRNSWHKSDGYDWVSAW